MTIQITQQLDRIENLVKLTQVSQRVRVTVCTQAAFDRLPAMVSRAEFMEWTGYSANELKAEVDEGRIEVYRPPGHTKARYYKREIARLGGWKM